MNHPMIGKFKFIQLLNDLRGNCDKKSKTLDTLNECIGNADILCETLYSDLENYVEMLNLLVGENRDDYSDRYTMIDWFVFENDFGRNDLYVGINGNDYDIDSAEKLWYLVTNQIDLMSPRVNSDAE